MDNDFKWFAIMAVGIMIAGSVAMGWESYSRAIETKAAMEHGYEQIESESGKVIWVKIRETTNED